MLCILINSQNRNIEWSQFNTVLIDLKVSWKAPKAQGYDLGMKSHSIHDMSFQIVSIFSLESLTFLLILGKSQASHQPEIWPINLWPTYLCVFNTFVPLKSINFDGCGTPIPKHMFSGCLYKRSLFAIYLYWELLVDQMSWWKASTYRV